MRTTWRYHVTPVRSRDIRVTFARRTILQNIYSLRELQRLTGAAWTTIVRHRRKLRKLYPDNPELLLFPEAEPEPNTQLLLPDVSPSTSGMLHAPTGGEPISLPPVPGGLWGWGFLAKKEPLWYLFGMARDIVLEQLYQLAEGQDGYFTTRQAADLGVDHHAINKAAYRGRIERTSRGVYRLGRFPILSERAHLWEAVLWPQTHEHVPTLLSHETVLMLYELSDVNPSQIHITVPRSFRLRRTVPSWLIVHRADVSKPEQDYVDGFPTTNVERTLRDIAQNGSPVVLHDAIRDAQQKGLSIPAELLHKNA